MQICKLQHFKIWMLTLEHKGEHPGQDIAKWKALSVDNYCSFVRGPRCSTLHEDRSLFNTFSSPTTVHASTKPTYTPVDRFRKGIKRDKASFPILKRDSKWTEFKRTMITESNALGVEAVFDVVLDHN